MLLVALACVTRVHAMLVPLGDSSMGLYVHVARAWLAGHAPYTTTWEFKPPGIFAIYALALVLIPSPAIALQFLGVACALATAYALVKIAPLVDPLGGAVTGRYAALFAVMLSIEDEGFLTDAEVLIAPCVAFAVWLALRGPTTIRGGFGIGLLLGLALQCKLSAAPLVVPVLAIVWLGARRVVPLLGASLGILGYFVIEIVGYAAIGQLPAFAFANGGATFARARGLRAGVVRENIPIFAEHLRIYAPAIELAFLTIGARFTARSALVTFGWLGAGLLSIVAIGEFYDRQFTLIYAPVALLGAVGLRRATAWLGAGTLGARVAVALAFAASFGLHDYYETVQGARVALARAGIGAPHVTDRLPIVLRGLACIRAASPASARDRSTYLISITPIAYDFAGLASPTRFPFTDHLLDDRMSIMIGVDPAAELRRIFATHPHVVVTDDDYDHNPRYRPERVRFIDERLARDYTVVARAPHTTFYVRDGSDAASVARRCGSVIARP